MSLSHLKINFENGAKLPDWEKQDTTTEETSKGHEEAGWGGNEGVNLDEKIFMNLMVERLQGRPEESDFHVPEGLRSTHPQVSGTSREHQARLEEQKRGGPRQGCAYEQVMAYQGSRETGWNFSLDHKMKFSRQETHRTVCSDIFWPRLNNFSSRNRINPTRKG